VSRKELAVIPPVFLCTEEGIQVYYVTAMRKRTENIIVILVIGSILVALLVPLLGDPRVYRIDKSIDANSGDLRVQVYICSLQTKSYVESTPFSREVRRLGIPLVENRMWRPVSTRCLTRGRHITYTYRRTIRQCDELMEMFDHGNVPDENRRIILQNILAALQSEKGGKLSAIDAELNSLAERVYRGKVRVRP
jgi:hypothetical protein